MKTALEEINQNIEGMGNKLSNMVAFVNFECKKVELMLQSVAGHVA